MAENTYRGTLHVFDGMKLVLVVSPDVSVKMHEDAKEAIHRWQTESNLLLALPPGFFIEDHRKRSGRLFGDW